MWVADVRSGTYGEDKTLAKLASGLVAFRKVANDLNEDHVLALNLDGLVVDTGNLGAQLLARGHDLADALGALVDDGFEVSFDGARHVRALPSIEAARRRAEVVVVVRQETRCRI